MEQNGTWQINNNMLTYVLPLPKNTATSTNSGVRMVIRLPSQYTAAKSFPLTFFSESSNEEPQKILQTTEDITTMTEITIDEESKETK